MDSALSDFVMFMSRHYPGGSHTRSGSLPHSLKALINVGLLDAVTEDHTETIVDLSVRRWLPFSWTIPEVRRSFPLLHPQDTGAALELFSDTDDAVYRHASMPMALAFNEAWNAAKALVSGNPKYALYLCASMLGVSSGMYSIRDASNCVGAILKGEDPHSLPFDNKPSYETY